MSAVTFFTYPSCTSCRKTKKWLSSHSVDVQERHLFRETPTKQELLKLLSMSSEGLDELLATRSSTFKSLNMDVDDMPLSAVIDLIIQEPKLLRRPILTDGETIVVGYNLEKLRSLTKKKQVMKYTG
ncbi:Spx/MgsR family RNA polymerase-binding regulatory protein [Domibacillus iocasae]|uniref:Transcriptional regulator n=1 Tax=Domibacillus iocasae TaxID=1714016 RepID=A0A1E7DMY6_9BACI|nr:Spx/MgsR family RNA polymerase-binding regulatory protein [Domibacillus iocasae]OES44375.1 transcriptional regulator [Domibacillus iocasae]